MIAWFQVAPVPQVPPVPDIPTPFPSVPFWVTLPPTTVALIFLGMTVGVVVVLWPVMRAIGRRLEGRTREDPALRREIDELRARLGEVDTLQHRLAELEERIDFTERMLAQHREPNRIQGAGDHG
jgi:hypothetical protein